PAGRGERSWMRACHTSPGTSRKSGAKYARGMSRRSLHTPAPAPATLRARLDKARTAAADAGTDALLISPGSDLKYLLGQAGGSFERLTTLVVPADDAPPALVLPKLEAPGFDDVPLDDLGVEVVTWVDGQDPYAIVGELAGRKGKPGRVAVSDAMIALHVLGLRGALSADPVLAGPAARQPRTRKDTDEGAAPCPRNRCSPDPCCDSCGCARTPRRSPRCAPPPRRSTACTLRSRRCCGRAAARPRWVRTSSSSSWRKATWRRTSSSSAPVRT